MSDIKTWSTAAASNNAASPNGFPEGMAPSGVNDAAREVMAAVRRWFESAQWTDLGDAPIYAGATTFTVAGDRTATYAAGRRVRLADAATLYGTIAASSYSAPNTTVTVSLDSGSISGSLSAVAVGILTPTNSAIPTVPVANGGTGAATASAARANLGAQQDVITTRGDLVRGSASNAAERVALGTKGQHLVSDGSDAKWGMLLRGYLAGLGTSNNSGAPATKIDVAAGLCADDTNAVMMQQPASMTIDCATVGALGLDSGALANNSWYHVFKIMKADGTDSLVASASVSSPTMPSGYTYKRRIGSFKTDGAAHIIAFVQNGDEFAWVSPPLDQTGANAVGTSAILFAVSVPTGVSVNFLAAGTNNAASVSNEVYVSDPATADLAVVNTGTPTAPLATLLGASYVTHFMGRTNTSAQVRLRGPANFVQVSISVVKWWDRRGRDD